MLVMVCPTSKAVFPSTENNFPWWINAPPTPRLIRYVNNASDFRAAPCLYAFIAITPALFVTKIGKLK